MYESIDQAGLKLIMCLGSVSNLQESSCLSLPIIGMFHRILILLFEENTLNYYDVTVFVKLQFFPKFDCTISLCHSNSKEE